MDSNKPSAEAYPMKIAMLSIALASLITAAWLLYPRDDWNSPILRASPLVTQNDIKGDFTCWEYQMNLGSYVSVTHIKTTGQGDAPIANKFIDPKKVRSANLKVWLGRRPNEDALWSLFIGLAQENLDGTSFWPGSALKEGLEMDEALRIAQSVKIMVSRSKTNGVEEMMIGIPNVLGKNKLIRVVTAKRSDAVKNWVKIDPGYTFFSWDF